MTTGLMAAGFASTGPESVRNIDPLDIDLSAVQREFEHRLDQLLDAWQSITADQRDQILDQVRSAVTSNDIAALAHISVSTAAATEALTQAMLEMALAAAQQLVHEAREQDVRLDPVASDSAGFHVLAGAMAALLAEGLTNAAGREAWRRWSPSTSGDVVSAAVKQHLESLSDTFLRDNLGSALTAAQNTGRLNTALSGPSAAVYASEQMDKRTCPPCAHVNGKWIGNSDDPEIESKVEAVYPNGAFRDCEGGPRCRGTTVYVWRPAQVTGQE
jgi:hypothetical protein